MTALQKDFADWVYRGSTVIARANQKLKVFAGPDVTQAEFMKACSEAASEACDIEIEKEAGKIDRQIASLQDKLAREKQELSQDKTELTGRNIETVVSGVEVVAGFFGIGRKKSLSTSLTKGRLSQTAKADVAESEKAISEYEKQLTELSAERTRIVDEIKSRWGDVVNDITEITITPKKTDIYVKLFGVAWMPFYIVQAGSETLELPAFGAE
jgi:multidrug resistance efflux pump